MSRFTTNDRVLWVIVGIGLLTAYSAIPATLHHVRKLTEVHDERNDERKRLKNDAEAALTPETLRVLADGPSYELRSAAIKIVVARCLNSSAAKKILLQDLASKDPETCTRATDALWLILDFPALKTEGIPSGKPLYAENFCNLAGFTALIDALVNWLPLHTSSANTTKPTTQQDADYPPPSPVKPLSRDPQEQSLIAMLGTLLNQHNSTTHSASLSVPLSAGLITRWLTHYPFPCAQPQNARYGFRKSDVFRLFHTYAWASDDVVMSNVMQYLDRDPEALKQLRQCGLRASQYTEAVSSRGGAGRGMREGWRVGQEIPVQDVLMADSEDTAGVNFDFTPFPDSVEVDASGEDIRPGSSWARQVPERSVEEDALRRRHREAIVMAERGTPISRDNILQRQNSRVGPTPLSAQDTEQHGG